MQTLTPSTNSVMITISQEHASSIIFHLIASKICFSVQPYVSEQQAASQPFDNEPIETTEVHGSSSKQRKEHFVDKIQTQINKLIKGSAIPNIEDLAKSLGITAPTFKLKFRKEFGKPFYQYYLEKKMEYAAILLKNGNTASYISEQMGYSHPIKFNKMFQKHYGITPKKYQMQYRRRGV